MKNLYLLNILKKSEQKYINQPEYLNTIKELLESFELVVNVRPEIEKYNIIERLIEPERLISFKVEWVDDNGNVQVNKGYRVQFNNAIGPYKGGLRFHPSVNESIIKFLGLEQCIKNSLTTLPMGGGKGGSDFDPKGKSECEIMRFCKAFMRELYHHIGQFTDVPAGDIGVGAREIGYLFGEYKRITNEYTGVLTGKPLMFGGSLVRTEATGFGLCYFALEALKNIKNTNFKNKTVCISGSGNVAIFAAQKAIELGAKVVTMSDSNGWIYDENGIDLEVIKDIKLIQRGRIKEYLNSHPKAIYRTSEDIIRLWSIKCDIALPCATQNEVHLEDAKELVKNGCIILAEGANMPTDLDATRYLIDNGVIFAPGKAANAGGVATSGLEMSQNSLRLSWSFEEVDARLKNIMKNIFENIYSKNIKYKLKDNDLLTGANIAGFEKICDAMIAQGV